MPPYKPQVDECLLATMYESGESIKTISHYFGTSRAYITSVIKRLGLPVRTMREASLLAHAMRKSKKGQPMIEAYVRWRANVHAKNQHSGVEPEGAEFCTYTLGEYATHTEACEAVGRINVDEHGAIGITIAPVEIGETQ